MTSSRRAASVDAGAGSRSLAACLSDIGARVAVAARGWAARRGTQPAELHALRELGNHE